MILLNTLICSVFSDMFLFPYKKNRIRDFFIETHKIISTCGMNAEGGPGRRRPGGGLREEYGRWGEGLVKDLVCLKDTAFMTPIAMYNEDTAIKRKLRALKQVPHYRLLFSSGGILGQIM